MSLLHSPDNIWGHSFENLLSKIRKFRSGEPVRLSAASGCCFSGPVFFNLIEAAKASIAGKLSGLLKIAAALNVLPKPE